VATYTLARLDPPAALQVRIRKSYGGAWLPYPLLAPCFGWACVDDGAGPLWVMLDHVHRLDWPQLRVFERLREGRN
jgi:hypothetical protein